jgi:hypothetical protein
MSHPTRYRIILLVYSILSGFVNEGKNEEGEVFGLALPSEPVMLSLTQHLAVIPTPLTSPT